MSMKNDSFTDAKADVDKECNETYNAANRDKQNKKEGWLEEVEKLWWENIEDLGSETVKQIKRKCG